jgi:predicted kinase
MNKSLLIIVSGPPSTGKTTLAKAIAQKFTLPLITKDSLKEILFDTVGWKDRDWSKKLGSASFSLLHYFLDSLMPTSQSIIIEGNFKTEFESVEISSRLQKYNYSAIQIMCQSDGQVLFDRFKKRSESGERHPGHCDTGNYDELKDDLLKGKYQPLNVNSPVIIFDSTDLNHLNYQPIFDQLSSYL